MIISTFYGNDDTDDDDGPNIPLDSSDGDEDVVIDDDEDEDATIDAVASVNAVAVGAVAIAVNVIGAVDAADINDDIIVPPALLKSILPRGNSLFSLPSSAFNSSVGSFILVIASASIAPSSITGASSSSPASPLFFRG